MNQIGFTGTRKGLTPEQESKLLLLLAAFTDYTLLHGDCVGADEQADTLAKEIKMKVEIHPCNLDDQRAFCTGPRTTILPVKPPLARNRDIVNASDWIIACPKSTEEEVRSGTWYTVRYALKRGKKVVVIFPDGTKREG